MTIAPSNEEATLSGRALRDRLRRPDAGDVAGGARPDDRLDRAADDRQRPRRPRPPVLGRHRLPAGLDGRRRRSGASSATCTDARRSSRPPSSSSSSARHCAAWRQSMPQLIAFRALQGARRRRPDGRAQAIIGDIVPPRERGRTRACSAPSSRSRPSPARCSAASSSTHLLALGLLRQPADRHRRAARRRAPCCTCTRRRSATPSTTSAPACSPAAPPRSCS